VHPHVLPGKMLRFSADSRVFEYCCNSGWIWICSVCGLH